MILEVWVLTGFSGGLTILRLLLSFQTTGGAEGVVVADVGKKVRINIKKCPERTGLIMSRT
jgi:hypothetical protein